MIDVAGRVVLGTRAHQEDPEGSGGYERGTQVTTGKTAADPHRVCALEKETSIVVNELPGE